jgi:hypothetical protein
MCRNQCPKLSYAIGIYDYSTIIITITLHILRNIIYIIGRTIRFEVQSIKVDKSVIFVTF